MVQREVLTVLYYDKSIKPNPPIVKVTNSNFNHPHRFHLTL